MCSEQKTMLNEGNMLGCVKTGGREVQTEICTLGMRITKEDTRDEARDEFVRVIQLELRVIKESKYLKAVVMWRSLKEAKEQGIEDKGKSGHMVDEKDGSGKGIRPVAERNSRVMEHGETHFNNVAATAFRKAIVFLYMGWGW